MHRIKKLWGKLIMLFRISDDKKHKLKRVLPGIVATIVIVTMTLITVYHSTDGFTTLIEVEYASLTTEYDTMSFTAYTLRNDMVLESPYPNGGILYVADNAQRMDVDEEMAKIYETSVDESVKKTVAYLDECITILEKSLDDGSFTLGDSKKVKEGIKTIYYTITKSIANGDASDISAYTNDLLILLNKMESYSGNKEKLVLLLEEYKARRAEYESYYRGDYVTLKSEMGGYYFRDTDGYENVFSSANIDELTYESFMNMTTAPSDEKGKVGKLMLDYKWYIAVPTVKDISSTYTQGTQYDVYFPDSGDRCFEMTLDKVIYDESGARGVMLFSCGVVDGSFDYLRVQRIEIVSRNITGYRVPERAVCELNGTTGVYVLKDGRASFRKIVTLYKGDGYYIVSADRSNSGDYYVYIELNDSIIVDCKNMYEGKVIE